MTFTTVKTNTITSVNDIVAIQATYALIDDLVEMLETEKEILESIQDVLNSH